MKTPQTIYVYQLQTGGCRLLTNPPVAPVGALKNPDLSKIGRLPACFWQIVDGKVLPMDPAAQAKMIKRKRALMPHEKRERRNLALAGVVGFLSAAAISLSIYAYEVHGHSATTPLATAPAAAPPHTSIHAEFIKP